MTGLRLGYLIAPKPFVRSIQKIQQNFYLSPNSIVQIRGDSGPEGSRRCGQNASDLQRAQAVHDRPAPAGIGFGITVEPTGAFYVFANARHIMTDLIGSPSTCWKKPMWVKSGVRFGPGGEGYLRFSYANSLDNITEALDRLERLSNT